MVQLVGSCKSLARLSSCKFLEATAQPTTRFCCKFHWVKRCISASDLVQVPMKMTRFAVTGALGFPLGKYGGKHYCRWHRCFAKMGYEGFCCRSLPSAEVRELLKKKLEAGGMHILTKKFLSLLISGAAYSLCPLNCARLVLAEIHGRQRLTDRPW